MKLRCQCSLNLRHLLIVRPRPLLIASDMEDVVSVELVDADSAVEAAEDAVESEDGEDVEDAVVASAVDGEAAAAEDTDAVGDVDSVDVAVETVAATDTEDALDATEIPE